MSHLEQVQFFTKIYNQHKEAFVGKKIIEIGSLDINGSLRSIFLNPNEYIGVDLEVGRGVDLVSKGHEIPFPSNFFDAALSSECFEHDKYWKQTFNKMYEVVKPSGFVIFSCATEGRNEHGTHATDLGSSPFTGDYYKNLTILDFLNNFELDQMFENWEAEVNEQHHDLYFWGQKL
jgi:SAM-dependent methyltransferase